MDKVLSKKAQIVLFYIMLFVCCFVLSIYKPMLDPDFWSRLIMGHNVFNFHEVMYHDIVSYTPTHVWYDHEWITSTLFYAVLKFFGTNGLIVLKGILYFLSVAIADLVIVQNQKKFFYNYKFLYIFIYFLILMHTLFMQRLRCQNFTYVFYPVLFLILERYRQNPKSNVIFLIPPLMLLWLNMHGGCMYGIGIMGLYLFGAILNRKPFKKLLIVIPLSMLMFFINPWGADFVKFMIDAISKDRSYISEWMSPFKMHPNLVVAYVFNVCIIVFMYIYSLIKAKVNLKTINYTKLLIMIATLIIAGKYIKYTYMFFITMFMILYEDVKVIFDDSVSFFQTVFKRTISLKIPLALAYIILIAAVVIKNPVDSFYANSESELPVAPAKFLEENHIKGRIFAPYYVSGFLAYKNYPNLKIYMDGRQEQVYSDDIFKRHVQFLFYEHQNAFDVLRDYAPHIILLETYWPAIVFLQQQALDKSPWYSEVYNDSHWAIYIHRDILKDKYKRETETKYYDIENIFKSKYFN